MKNPFSPKRKPNSNSGSNSDARRLMDNARLDTLIRELSGEVEGKLGYWQFAVKGRQLLVMTDERYNRMRIMTPITAQHQLNQDILTTLLEANYDRALDAKYALSNDTLWSVFTHPLKELTDEQFIGCVGQVATLADNFGSSYASGNLFFGGG